MPEAAVAAKPTRSVAVNPSRVSEAEFAQTRWIATAEPGTVIDDLTKTDYWSHNAARFTPGDRVEVRSEDFSWIVELTVRERGSNWAILKVLHEYKFEQESEATGTVLHRIEWRGPHLKFCVERVSDGARVKEGCTREEAQNWLRDYENATR